NDEGRRTVRIHVVGTVLGIVFQDENCRAGPKARLGDTFHQLADGVIVIGGGGKGGDLARGGPRCVVVAQAHHDQARHMAGLLIFRQFIEKNLGAIHVGIVEVEAAVERVGYLGQHRVAHAGDLLGAGGGVRLVVDHVAEVAQGKAGRHGIGPEVAGGGQRGGVLLFEIVGNPAAGVLVGPHLLHVIGGDGGGGPVMAVGGDVAVDIEVVQQDEFAGQFVKVGGGVFTEEDQRRVAVALLQVAQHHLPAGKGPRPDLGPRSAQENRRPRRLRGP